MALKIDTNKLTATIKVHPDLVAGNDSQEEKVSMVDYERQKRDDQEAVQVVRDELGSRLDLPYREWDAELMRAVNHLIGRVDHLREENRRLEAAAKSSMRGFGC